MTKAEIIKMKMRKSVLEKYSKKDAIKLITKAYDDGEPVFIILGHDKLAWQTIKGYAEKLKTLSLGEKFKQDDSPSYDLAEAAERYAAFVIEWQGLNMELIKLPD